MTRTTEYRYNVDGLLTELVCRNGDAEQVTEWEYGVELYTVEAVSHGVARNDLVRAKIYPDGGGDRVDYTYDRLGEVVKFADQNGNVHEYSYDTIGRMTEDYAAEVPYFDVGQVRHIRVDYAPRGEVIHVYSKDAGQEHILSEVEYTYNGFGQVLDETVSTRYTSGQTVSYAYNSPTSVPNSVRRTGMTYPSGRALSFAYSGNVIDERMDRLSTIVGDPGGTPFDIAKYSWLGAGTSVKTEFTQPQVEMTTVDNDADGDAGDKYVGLDRFGRLEDARWKKSGDDIERVEYGFDRVGNRTWRRNRVAADENFDEHYGYDGLYQVTGLQRGKMNQNRTAIGGVPTWAEGWRYDEMGNWLGYTANGGGTDLDQRRTYNAANELLMISEGADPLSNATLAHDPAGNMTRMPAVEDWDESRVLKWDAWNRLRAIYEADGTTLVAKYEYDGLNRRIYKESKEGGVTVKRYFAHTDEWQVMEEFTGSGTPVALTLERSFVWGAKMLDDLILRDIYNSGGTVTSRYYALNDGKNVTAIVNTSGVVQERYAYRGFGYTEVLAANFTARTPNASLYTWETRFCGYRWDQESGLYQVRYRYYHSGLGRWLSRDPIGEKGGVNLYGMVRNRTVSLVDRLGHNEFFDSTTIEQWYQPRLPLPTPFPKPKPDRFTKCGCDAKELSKGEGDLRSQAGKIKAAIHSGDIKPGDDPGSCKVNHACLMANLEVPPCWQCYQITGGTRPGTDPVDGTYKFILGIPFKQLWRDHSVVFCDAFDKDGNLVNQIILDITGPYDDPVKWKESYPDYKPNVPTSGIHAHVPKWQSPAK